MQSVKTFVSFLRLGLLPLFSISFLLFYSRKHLDNECLITEQGRLSNGIKACKRSTELFSPIVFWALLSGPWQTT